MARRPGHDLEVVERTNPLVPPLRPSRGVGAAVFGDQLVAGKALADYPLRKKCHVVQGVEVANGQPPGELGEIPLDVLQRHLAEHPDIRPLHIGPHRLERVDALAILPEVEAHPVVDGPVSRSSGGRRGPRAGDVT